MLKHGQMAIYAMSRSVPGQTTSPLSLNDKTKAEKQTNRPIEIDIQIDRGRRTLRMNSRQREAHTSEEQPTTYGDGLVLCCCAIYRVMVIESSGGFITRRRATDDATRIRLPLSSSLKDIGYATATVLHVDGVLNTGVHSSVCCIMTEWFIYLNVTYQLRCNVVYIFPPHQSFSALVLLSVCVDTDNPQRRVIIGRHQPRHNMPAKLSADEVVFAMRGDVYDFSRETSSLISTASFHCRRPRNMENSFRFSATRSPSDPSQAAEQPHLRVLSCAIFHDDCQSLMRAEDTSDRKIMRSRFEFELLHRPTNGPLVALHLVRIVRHLLLSRLIPLNHSICMTFRSRVCKMATTQRSRNYVITSAVEST